MSYWPPTKAHLLKIRALIKGAEIFPVHFHTHTWDKTKCTILAQEVYTLKKDAHKYQEIPENFGTFKKANCTKR